jgi:hypothetical protein
LAIAGIVVAVLVDASRNPTWMKLSAVHDGEVVVLFSTRNQIKFEQARRALIRAVEINRGPAP